MDASYKIQRGIHVHLIQFFMCPEFWVHINSAGLRKLVLLLFGVLQPYLIFHVIMYVLRPLGCH